MQDSGFRIEDSAKAVAILAATLLLAACGDKVPQSEAAKKLGLIPKQTVDRAAERTNEALRKGAERSVQEEQRGEKKP